MDSSLEKYRQDLEIIRETAAQLIRDFSIHKLEIVFSGNELTAYDELIFQVEPFIADMYKNNRSGFQLLLYQIDISEQSFKKVISTSLPENFSKRISEMIIQREFQKILTKRFFR